MFRKFFEFITGKDEHFIIIEHHGSDIEWFLCSREVRLTEILERIQEIVQETDTQLSEYSIRFHPLSL